MGILVEVPVQMTRSDGFWLSLCIKNVVSPSTRLDRCESVPGVPGVPVWRLTCENERDFRGQSPGIGVPGVPAPSNSLSLRPPHRRAGWLGGLL